MPCINAKNVQHARKPIHTHTHPLGGELTQQSHKITVRNIKTTTPSSCLSASAIISHHHLLHLFYHFWSWCHLIEVHTWHQPSALNKLILIWWIEELEWAFCSTGSFRRKLKQIYLSLKQWPNSAFRKPNVSEQHRVANWTKMIMAIYSFFVISTAAAQKSHVSVTEGCYQCQEMKLRIIHVEAHIIKCVSWG